MRRSPEKLAKSREKAFYHFRKRAFERHGLVVDEAVVRLVVQDIKLRQAEFLTWVENDEAYRAFYRVRIFDKPYIVAYDFEIDTLITIYHGSWLKFEDGRWVANVKTRKHAKWRENRRDSLYQKRKGLVTR